MPEAAKRRRGRPPSATARGRIVEASWGLFLAHGVEPVSVDAIAAAAGLSKATLYKHFRDKAAMFEAGVQLEQHRIEAARASAAPPTPAGLEERLQAFGEATFAYITSDPAIDFYSVLAGELRARPDLARLFYDAGPGRTRRDLAGLLNDAANAGDLPVENPDDAADMLFGLWQGFTNFELALGINVETIRADLAARIRRGIDLFLRARSNPAEGHEAQKLP